MATQRITLAKIGGVSSDVLILRLREWSLMRQAPSRSEWSSEQWPAQIRKEADEFADRLRTNALVPPVIHFVEWADMWSMGDMFHRWLTPPDGPPPLVVYADRFEVYAYCLPDGGRLARHLANAGPQQWGESDWFANRLREAIGAWQELVERATLVVLRQVASSSVLDEEVAASLKSVPDWLSS